jgi:endonuclease/exonuclease/phosphatase (EEP) superfamily protein YafD
MRRVARFTIGLFTLGAWLYSAGLLGLIYLWSAMPERPWVALTSIFGPLWFAPLVIVLPASLIARSWWLGGAAWALLIMFLALFGQRLAMPLLAPPGSGPALLRVATINQRYDNLDSDAVVRAILDQQADLVAIQELSPGVAQRLSALKSEFPYQQLQPAENQSGLGLLSRYPIDIQEPLDNLRSQRALVQIGHERLTVINLHIHHSQLPRGNGMLGRAIAILKGYNARSQLEQSKELVRQTRTIGGPLIVLGDFNTSDREPAYQVLAQALRDSYLRAGYGFGFTFPSAVRLGPLGIPLPVLRLDYIWTNDALVANQARVVCHGASDHCLVVAGLSNATPQP